MPPLPCACAWHRYVYAGGLSYELTEGDVLAVFSQARHGTRVSRSPPATDSCHHTPSCASPQYGEIVDVNLVRDRETGKSKGFAFVAYEDQRSTVLAVDNLSGARVVGRTVRVEHVDDYKLKRKEVGYTGPVPCAASSDLLSLLTLAARWSNKAASWPAPTWNPALRPPVRRRRRSASLCQRGPSWRRTWGNTPGAAPHAQRLSLAVTGPATQAQLAWTMRPSSLR